jgi:hypothetical protein
MTTYIVEEIHTYEVEAEDEAEAVLIATAGADSVLVNIETNQVYEKPTPPANSLH